MNTNRKLGQGNVRYNLIVCPHSVSDNQYGSRTKVSRLTQPNPTHGNVKNTTQTQPNPTLPMGEPNPRPCLTCPRALWSRRHWILPLFEYRLHITVDLHPESHDTLSPCIAAAALVSGEVDLSSMMEVNWPTVGVSPSRVSHAPADTVTSQPTLVALDHQLQLFSRFRSLVTSSNFTCHREFGLCEVHSPSYQCIS